MTRLATKILKCLGNHRELVFEETSGHWVVPVLPQVAFKALALALQDGLVVGSAVFVQQHDQPCHLRISQSCIRLKIEHLANQSAVGRLIELF